MKRRSLFSVVALVLLSSFVPVLHAHTNTIVVPKEQANAFGNRFGVLFGPGGFAQIYGATELADIPNGVIAISAIAFRWDETQNGPIDVTVPRVSLRMGVSTYDGANFSEYVRNVTPVFESRNVRLTGTESRPPAQFEIVFLLQVPFIYDRRQGRLVLQGIVSQVSPQVDGQSTGDGDSFYILPESTDSDPHGGPEVMVTKFFYRIVPTIDSIQRVTDSVTMDISLAADEQAHVETASTINGPFRPEANIEIVEIAPGKLRAKIPISQPHQFVRIKAE